MSKTTTLSAEKVELFRQILVHLSGLEPKATGQVNIKCPIHGDLTSDSFSANLDEATWTCHGACDTFGGLKELQAHLRDALRRQPPDHCFEYVDEMGTRLYQVYRWDDFPVPGKKEFMTRSPGGAWSLNGARKVLYRLPEVLAADIVFIVEGEKCADRLADALALRADGEKEIEGGATIAVTTHPFGANKAAWLPEYSETLRGKKVVILPDNDEAGWQHAQRVARAIHGIAASVRLVTLSGLPEKGDIVDWLDAGYLLGELMDLIEDTPELTEDDLAAWEETERPLTGEVLKSSGTLVELVTLAQLPGVLKDPEAVKRFLALDPVDRWDFNNLLGQNYKRNQFWVESFWKLMDMLGTDQDIPEAWSVDKMFEAAAKPPVARVVEKLLIRGGLSIVGADPKCGKSTMARNAVVAVLQGGEFLGRKCAAGPVVYYAVEGNGDETMKHLVQLEMDRAQAAHLRFGSGAFPRLKFLDQLRRDIEEMGATFAVIDPLADVLLLTDINNYMEVNRAIKPLVDVADKTGCHIMVLHHTNKAGAPGSAKSFLGSAQLPGATETNIMLYRLKENRYIKTDHRNAFDEPIPATKILYDKATGRVHLGGPLSDEESTGMLRRDRILEVLAQAGQPLNQTELFKSVGGNRDVFNADLEQEAELGHVLVRRNGRALLYQLPDLPEGGTVETPSAGVEKEKSKRGRRKPSQQQ